MHERRKIALLVGPMAVGVLLLDVPGESLKELIAHGEKITKLDNLISMNTSTSYDLARGRFTGPISSSMTIAPTQYVTASVSWQNVAPYRQNRWGQFENLTIDLSSNVTGGGKWSGLLERLSPSSPRVSLISPREATLAGSSPVDTLAGQPQVPAAESLLAGAPPIPAAPAAVHGQYPWSFALAASARRSSDTRKFTNIFANGSLDLQLTPSWRVSYSAAYDFDRRQLSSQDYSISRDLHCWEARFVRRYNNGSWEYYFRIGVKDLPEVYLEKGTRYIGTPHIPALGP